MHNEGGLLVALEAAAIERLRIVGVHVVAVAFAAVRGNSVFLCGGEMVMMGHLVEMTVGNRIILQSLCAIMRCVTVHFCGYYTLRLHIYAAVPLLRNNDQ